MNVTTVSELLQTVSISELEAFRRYSRETLQNQYFLLVPYGSTDGKNKLITEANLFKYIYKRIFLFLVSFKENDFNKIEFTDKVEDHCVFKPLYEIFHHSSRHCENPVDLYSIICEKYASDNYDTQDLNKSNIADYFCNRFQYFCFGNEKSEIRTLRIEYKPTQINKNVDINIAIGQETEYSTKLPNKLVMKKYNNGLFNFERYSSIGGSHTGVIEDIQCTIDALKNWVDQMDGITRITNTRKGQVIVTTANKDELMKIYKAPDKKSWSNNMNYEMNDSLADGRFIYADGTIESVNNGSVSTYPANSKNGADFTTNNLKNLSGENGINTMPLEQTIKHNHGKLNNVTLLNPQMSGGSDESLPHPVSQSIASGSYSGLYLSEQPQLYGTESGVSFGSSATPIYDAEESISKSNMINHENLPPYYTARIVIVKTKN